MKTKAATRVLGLIFFFVSALSIQANSIEVGPSILTSKEIIANKNVCLTCGVTSRDIFAYLTDFGYTVISLAPANDGTCNVIATTKNSYHTLVQCSSTSIVGHLDLPW